MWHNFPLKFAFLSWNTVHKYETGIPECVCVFVCRNANQCRCVAWGSEWGTARSSLSLVKSAENTRWLTATVVIAAAWAAPNRLASSSAVNGCRHRTGAMESVEVGACGEQTHYCSVCPVVPSHQPVGFSLAACGWPLDTLLMVTRLPFLP